MALHLLASMIKVVLPVGGHYQDLHSGGLLADHDNGLKEAWPSSPLRLLGLLLGQAQPTFSLDPYSQTDDGIKVRALSIRISHSANR